MSKDNFKYKVLSDDELEQYLDRIIENGNNSDDGLEDDADSIDFSDQEDINVAEFDVELEEHEQSIEETHSQEENITSVPPVGNDQSDSPSTSTACLHCSSV